MPEKDKTPKFDDTEEIKSSAPSFDETEPIDGLKKKEPTNLTSTSSVPSVSVGGTSGLENGASALPKTPIDFEGARTYKAPTKTALGNKVISYTKPSPTIGLDEERSNKKLIADTETKKLVDEYDSQKALRGPDEKLNTANFYLENLKKTNPDEYKYTIDKQAALSQEGDPLKIQEYQADLIKKATSLKAKVMGGKLDIITNNINDNYKPILDDFDKTTKEAEGLSTKIKGIDDFINQNFQKDENGQLITTPTNRKVAEDMIKQRDELVNQFNSNKTKLDEYSNNQDLQDAITQLDDIQKEYDSAAELYKGFAEKDPDFYKGLPEVKKQIEKEQRAQFSKDLLEPLEGDMGIMEGSGRGATSIAKSLAYGVKNLGEDKGYGWTDEFYDNVKGSMDKIDNESNVLPTGYDKPVYEDGKWNLNYLPGKLSQTIVEMAPMAIATAGIGSTAGLIARGAAAKELGYTLGSFVGEHVAVASNYYDEAREAGMSEDEAQDFANKTATMQAAISMISPDLKLLKSNKLGLDDYTKMIAQGVSKKEAAKQTAKNIVNNMMKEVPQENLQTWKEIQDQNAMYESMGLNDKVKKSITNDIVETTIVSTLLTAGLGIGGAKSASSMQKQAAFMAASQPDIIVARAQKMLEKGTITQEQFDDVTIKMAKASEALQKIDKTLPAETKADVLPAMIEKNDLKAEKQLVDDSQHDAINEKIKLKDEEIKNITESPSKEQKQYDDFLKGFDAEISSISEDKPVVEIPKSENQMQLEGLIEKDDSQKSVPIELNPQLETIQEPTEQEKVDNQIAMLEKAIDDMKRNEFWQEKITAQQFGERSRAIEKEITKLKKPVAIEQEKIAETPAVEETPVVEEKKADVPFAEMKKSEVKTEPFAVTKKVEGGHQGIIVDPKTKKETVVGIYRDEKTAGEMANQTITDKKTSKAWDSSKKETKAVTAPKPTVEVTTEKPAEKKKEPDNSSLIDEEEETVVKDDSDTVKKMLDDLEILKQYSPNNVKMDGKTGEEIKNLATKKYQGMIERAYKAKLEGKINKSTYTLFRNDANDILGPKIAEKNREVKGQIDAIKETIKEKLLGQGYKNVLLSAPGINPKTVADLIDLTADLVKRGVDAGHAVRKAVDVALNYVKKHPNYNDILSSEKIPESKFRKMFEAKVGQLESIVQQSTEEETPAAKPTEEKTTTNKKTDIQKEMNDLLDKGIQNNRVRREELIKEGKTVDEANEITYKEFLETKEGKRYTELLTSSEKQSEKKSDKKEIKSSKDVSVGDVLTDINGKKGTVTGIDGDKITMKMESGGNFSANPKVVELFKEEKTTETQSNKETVDTTAKETNTASENTSQSNENPVIDEAPTSKEKQTKTGKRLSASERYNDVLKTVDDKSFNYKSMKKADVEKYVNEQLDKFNDGMLVDLANDMIKGNNPFDAKVQKVAEGMLIERLRSMAEDSSISAMDKQMLNQVSGKLAVKLSEAINITATQLSLHEIITKALPLSEEGVVAFTEEKLKDVQESYLSNDQKQDVTDIDKMVRDMVEAEINRITEEVQGKEWSDEMDAKIDSLKLDLSEC
jgi:hypothetical protein